MRAIAILLAGLVMSGSAVAEEIGAFTNDWTGNKIIIEAIADPKVQGVTCHVTRFDRSLFDRLSKGKWFEDPSNTSIACRQTGPLTIGPINMTGSGEDVFAERMSLIFKHIAVRRIYDSKNETLIYVAYSREVKDASAKMSVSTVTLLGSNAQWLGRKN
jgi:CreA protein